MDLTTFETSEKYHILVGEAVWPIAKSLPKNTSQNTSQNLRSSIFEHRIGFLRQNNLP